MTVWVYVDTRKQVGDKESPQGIRRSGCRTEVVRRTRPEGVAFEYPVTPAALRR
jgi:hypothetical protein